MRNCLNCKYEPKWGEWTKGEYRRCTGACRFVVDLSEIPAAYRIIEKHVTRYSDDSGVHGRCVTWEEKPNKQLVTD